jgi:hypothetical protein
LDEFFPFGRKTYVNNATGHLLGVITHPHDHHIPFHSTPKMILVVIKPFWKFISLNIHLYTPLLSFVEMTEQWIIGIMWKQRKKDAEKRRLRDPEKKMPFLPISVSPYHPISIPAIRIPKSAFFVRLLPSCFVPGKAG